MTKPNIITVDNPQDLAQELGLTALHAQQWQVQHTLLKRLRRIVKEQNLTHNELAQRSGSSRTRVTAILNGNLDNVSTDLLIRLLGALGYQVKVSVSRAQPAA